MNLENEFGPEQEPIPEISSIDIYFVRHGKSVYEEEWGEKSKELLPEEERNKTVAPGFSETGKWNPSRGDLTQQGTKEAIQVGKNLASLIDPEREIAIIWASPRARTVETARHIKEQLSRKGVEVAILDDTGGLPVKIMNILRSKGDFSPQFDEKTSEDKPADRRKGVSEELIVSRQDKSTGWRLIELLSFFAAIDKARLNKAVQEKSFFKGKKPVFINVTHNEVLEPALDQLGISPTTPDLGSIRTGGFMRLTLDLNQSGNFKLWFPAISRTDQKNYDVNQEFQFDQKSGAIELGGKRLGLDRGNE
jgi:hypothetical protein